MLCRITAVVASILVHQLQFLYAAGPIGAKPFPGLENLPKPFWHHLSSPFTEVYEVESIATETGGTPEPRPFFEDSESNITVQLGANVYMHCRVQNLQDTLKADQESEDSPDQFPTELAEVFGLNQTDSVECLNKTGVTEADMKKLTFAINISDLDEITCEVKDKKHLKSASCAMVCCAQKKGLVIGRDVQVEEMSKYIQGIFLKNVEVPVRNAVGICKEEVTEISDECMAGFEFVKCMYKAIRIMGQNMSKD